MPVYLLRVEGVNFGNVISDTDDISTRRGGGLMLLDAIKQWDQTWPKELRERHKLKPILTAASVGLFEFEADEKEATQLREAIEEHYRTGSVEYQDQEDAKSTKHLRLCHGTFVVDVLPLGKNAAETEQLLVAANRRQQLQSPTVSLCDIWDRNATAHCPIDLVRPAVEMVRLPEGRGNVSASVAERRAYGRNRRQQFYKDELDLEIAVTDDLSALAEIKNLETFPVPTNLKDKMAVFYVDGNKFGEMTRNKWLQGQPTEKVREWSHVIKNHHCQVLKEMLQKFAIDPTWRTEVGEKELRFETLLWGGDEMAWVVPAWKGWELAEAFFCRSHKVKIGKAETPLTYAGGLVFCNHKTPIQRAFDLAYNLGNAAKFRKDEHYLCYEVLESFDDITGDLGEHRRKWLPKDFDVNLMAIRGSNLARILDAVREIRRAPDFPKRQLFMYCRRWREGKDSATLSTHLKRMDASGAKAALESLRNCLGDTAYLQLLQMYDYVDKRVAP